MRKSLNNIRLIGICWSEVNKRPTSRDCPQKSSCLLSLLFTPSTLDMCIPAAQGRERMEVKGGETLSR